MTIGRAAIIGAGLSGLAAGCYARMNDHQVTIFEQLGWEGGLARSWDREGFRMDPGPELIWGHAPGTGTHDLLRELGVLPGRGIPPLRRWEVSDEKGARKVNLCDTPDELESQLKQIAPEDNDHIEDLIDAISMIDAVELLDSIEAMPSDFGGLGSNLAERWKSRKYQRYLRGPWSAPMSQWSGRLHDPFLRRAMCSISSVDTPAWLIPSILSLATKGQLGRVDGGSDGLVHDLSVRFRRLGGEIELRSTVGGIMAEGGRVKGVSLADARESPADAVISASDGRQTIYGLLGGRFVDDEVDRRYRDWKPSTPRVSISIGVGDAIDGLPPMQTVLLDEPISVGTVPNFMMRLRGFTSEGGYSPPGKSLIAATFESDWQFWYKLRALDRRMYEEEKARIGQIALGLLERIYPGMSGKAELVEVSTPFTAWKATQSCEGAPCGWSLTTETLSARPMRTIAGLKGLYIAGPWAAPVLGVTGCLFSGKHAVQTMCRERERPFKAMAPLN
ncbi:MAG TPA: NAD(P)/FAD-dependent oxidoreductase [Methanomassiliicoccales archaeon]|nr:NAD(P)/FAD-dependent oxidoreductase [Methanomassiliicoccales archaeon]